MSTDRGLYLPLHHPEVQVTKPRDFDVSKEVDGVRTITRCGGEPYVVIKMPLRVFDELQGGEDLQFEALA